MAHDVLIVLFLAAMPEIVGLQRLTLEATTAYQLTSEVAFYLLSFQRLTEVCVLTASQSAQVKESIVPHCLF